MNFFPNGKNMAGLTDLHILLANCSKQTPLHVLTLMP